jgi:hypothetical protein
MIIGEIPCHNAWTRVTKTTRVFALSELGAVDDLPALMP